MRNGSYEFLKEILIRFNIYEGRTIIIAKNYGYKFSLVKNYSSEGINRRFWRLLHLDLSILSAINPEIKYTNLEQLKKEMNVR